MPRQEIHYPLVDSNRISSEHHETAMGISLYLPVPSTLQTIKVDPKIHPIGTSGTDHFRATKQNREILYPSVGSCELNAAVQNTVVANYLVQPVPSTRQPGEAYREVVPNGIAKTAHFRATKQNREIHHPSVGTSLLDVGGMIFLAAKTPW
jgi:hypothetical protein